jgi:hypothetical protein
MVVPETKRRRGASPSDSFSGFIMRVPGRDFPDEMLSWARDRFVRVRVLKNGLDDVVLGAIWHKRGSRGWERFRSNVLMRFKSWGIHERTNHYERGWLTPCSFRDFRKAFRNPTVRARWPRLLRPRPFPGELRRLKNRRRVIDGGPLVVGHASMGDCMSAKNAFEVLADLVHERRAAREKKKAQFNKERFGEEDVPISKYTISELDHCDNWPQVALKRGPPRSLREQQERDRTEKVGREQAFEIRCRRELNL